MSNVKTAVVDFDALGIRGPRVTKIEDLTEGRWYIISAGRGYEVHAQCIGYHFGVADFTVLEEDRVKSGLAPVITRTQEEVSTGKRGSCYADLPAEIYKFSTHSSKVAKPACVVEVAPTALSRESHPEFTVGQQFVVVKDSPTRQRIGSVYELIHNDNTPNPFFKLVSGGVGSGVTDEKRFCAHWDFLAPLAAPVPEPVVAPEPLEEPTPAAKPVAAPVHYVDDLKARIDELERKAARKREIAAVITDEAAALNKQANDLRAELTDSLRGYLSVGPKPFRV